MKKIPKNETDDQIQIGPVNVLNVDKFDTKDESND